MDESDLAAARLLLSRLGVTAEQLLGSSAPDRPMPTFRDYVDQVATAVPPGTRRVYGTYWRRVVEAWGDRTIDEPTPLEIMQLAEHVKANVVVRKNSRGGRSAAEHLVAALRCLYRYAAADQLIPQSRNPAVRVAKPRRLASTRRALPVGRLAEIIEVAASTGNDPELDTLLLRLHTETACRRGGALALRIRDLDVAQSLVQLREKGETVRWQPVSPTLMQHLVIHHQERRDPEGERLFHYRNGNPISARRYDYLWRRIGRHLPWVATQQVSTHWLRHTTLTWVERHYGYAVARAYAGHSGKGDGTATSTYIRADVHEVAEALAALVGEPHPLAISREMRSAGDTPPFNGLDHRAAQRRA